MPPTARRERPTISGARPDHHSTLERAASSPGAPPTERGIGTARGHSHAPTEDRRARHRDSAWPPTRPDRRSTSAVSGQRVAIHPHAPTETTTDLNRRAARDQPLARDRRRARRRRGARGRGRGELVGEERGELSERRAAAVALGGNEGGEGGGRSERAPTARTTHEKGVPGEVAFVSEGKRSGRARARRRARRLSNTAPVHRRVSNTAPFSPSHTSHITGVACAGALASAEAARRRARYVRKGTREEPMQPPTRVTAPRRRSGSHVVPTNV